MRSDDLIATLRTLGREANQLTEDTLNCGGCGVYASIVSDALTALGIEHEIVACLDESDSIDEVRPDDPLDPREWYDNNAKFLHVGLRMIVGAEAWLYDSDGFYPAEDRVLNSWTVADGALTPDEIRALAGYTRRWNRTFDRSQIPALKELVATTLLAGVVTPMPESRL